jgi:prolipoprotein diacylglyceryltransferase
MQQILFHIPLTSGLLSGLPEGIPIYGFGAMLFLTFVLTALVWGPRRVVKVGMPKEKLQDLAIVLFLTGIAGARLVYMIQYYDRDFPDKSAFGLFKSFFQIWNGGIVFYGSIFGGIAGYIVFYRLVLRKFSISTWKLADAVAPLIALGLAVGRIGCYLNGCCWGQVACPECQVVPLSPALGEFPLLPAHARDQVVRPASREDRLPFVRGLQTSTGFSIPPRDLAGRSDPRTVILAVEPGSAAAKAGLQPGDRVVEVNGQPNQIVLELSGSTSESLGRAMVAVKAAGGIVESHGAAEEGVTIARASFSSDQAHRQAVAAAATAGVTAFTHDTFWELAREWPRGQNQLKLVVERNGERIPLTFTPRTVTFYATQLYETISMVLLILLLLAFQPFRRHDGQVMVLLMLGYAAHRFLNEAIRIEPTYAMGLTLSQWISVGIALAAAGLELFLRQTQSKLPEGLQPLRA